MNVETDKVSHIISTAGCVVVSHLSQAGLGVHVFEAGPEDYFDQVMSPLASPALHGSHLDYNFLSKEQGHFFEPRNSLITVAVFCQALPLSIYVNWTLMPFS